MKNNLLTFKSAALVFGLAIMIAGCKKDDLTTPVITLNGDTPIKITLGDAYTDLGATASDDVDGDLTSTIITDQTGVDVTTIGKYTVTYSVTDNAGNTGSKTREVWVVADPDSYAGNYHVAEDCGPDGTFTFDISISAGADPNTIVVNNFGGYGATTNVVVNISGDLGDQLTVDYTTGGADFLGNGSVTVGTTTDFKFNMDYSATGGATITCSDVCDNF